MRRTVLLLASTALGLLLAFGVALVAVEHAAEATFPGSNGKLAFSTGLGMYTINPDGTGRSEVSDVDTKTRECSQPAWSPDGTKLAAVCWLDGYTTSGIRTMNADGSNGVWVNTSDEGLYTRPSWSPSGDQLAYSHFPERTIWVTNADGTGNPRQLINGEGDSPAWGLFQDWSPDGRRIAFVGPGDELSGDEIFVVNVDGTDVKNLTNTGDDAESTPSWSPDGTKIAFERSLNGRLDIWTMNADGSNKTNLTESASDVSRAPFWSPDGTKIAFERGEDIWTMNADGTDVKNLTNTGDDAEFFPTWQPLPAPSGPKSKAECKNGGYEAFGFKSQGECVASVQRAPKSK